MNTQFPSPTTSSRPQAPQTQQADTSVLHRLVPSDTCGYPELLRHIPIVPEFLWMRSRPDVDISDNPENHKFLCVVGSRSHSPYGTEACYRIIEGLRGYPITIVSGLAFGIDSHAHEAALKAGLRTIAIPGSGLDWNVLYPSRHTSLAERIIAAGGALLSPFDPDLKAAPWCFPWRNHIMAGMSHMTLVIEAGERSGTLITADYALDFNRDVGAVPGSIFSTTSRGAHGLIRRGAITVTSSADIIEALGLPISADSKCNSLASTKHKFNLTPAEEKILTLIEARPCTRSELLRETAISIDILNASLTRLELDHLIRDVVGTFYVAGREVSM